MTAATLPATARTGGSRDLAGTGTLLRLALRRDRLMIPAWVVLLGLTVVSMSSALEKLYDTAAKRAEVAVSMTANGSLRAVYGPVFSDSLGGLTAWRIGGVAALLAGVMSLLIVVRHTREEEETGRQELLSAAMVGRRAPLTAALLAAFIADAALALLITAGLAGAGRPADGALALGLAIGGTGLLFAGLAAITAQLTESARAAKGLAGAVLGAAFVLRAAGDAASQDASSPLTWMSPVGWAENLRAFGDERWWVLLLFLAGTAVTVGAAYTLTARRDLGMSFLPARPGPPRAPASLNGPTGLAWRLQRTTLFGWAAGFLLAGAVFGSITDGVSDLVGDNEQAREIFERMGGQQGLAEAFVSALSGILGMVAALYAAGAVLRLRGEETGDRAEPVLAGAVGRLRWAAGHLAVAFLGTALILLLGGLGLGFAYGLTVGDVGGQLGPAAGAALAQVPAVWTLTGLAVLLVGALPRAAAATWAVVGGCLGIGWLGPAVQLPQWVMNLSPFSHLPKLPGGEATAAPFLWLFGLTAVFVAVGLAGLRRRDIG
ncbi:ABC transporter permease [Streptomyces sp. NPDC059788]|uniref:ABC transporter permease n=1 Tax=Streptomyces sp. NPDC059788 TaxID=3346948 RepID=UPI00366923C1